MNPPDDQPPKDPRGRPSDLTPAMIERVCTYLRAGSYFKVACSLAGIGERTGLRWLKNGREEQEAADENELEQPQEPTLFWRFWQSVHRAEDEAEARAVLGIQKAGATDWKALAFYLERKHPERWGRVDRLKAEVTGKDGGPVEVTTTVLEKAAQELAQWRQEQTDALLNSPSALPTPPTS